MHPPVFAASGRSGGRCCFYLASSLCRLYRDVWPHCGSVRLVTAWLLGALCSIWLALGAIDFAIAATPPAMYSLSPLHNGFHTDGRVFLFGFYHGVFASASQPPWALARPSTDSIVLWLLPRRFTHGQHSPSGRCFHMPPLLPSLVQGYCLWPNLALYCWLCRLCRDVWTRCGIYSAVAQWPCS